ncbi:MAG TPA: MmcQ/YjbR family DNA-binding protein [bacterium]|nr:MmcQ/YjbR family DNA-binding protein [bacterium]
MKKSSSPFTGPTYQKYKKLFLSHPGAVETFPFGPEVAVYKTYNKMFGTLVVEEGVWYSNLKCDPFWTETLRKKYKAIQPGYHMNKKHWNTITLDGSLPDSLIRQMAELSYVLVLPQKLLK